MLAAAQFPNLTKAERAMLWFSDVDNIDRGEIAAAGPNSNPSDPGNDPAHADKWDHQREIRATLIRWLCVYPDAMRRVDPLGIAVLGARIVGGLNLSRVHVPLALTLRDCWIPEPIKLESAELPAIDFDGSYTGEINAIGIKVKGTLSMALGFHAAGAVFLEGATIDGDAIFAGAHVNHSTTKPSDLRFDQLKLFNVALVLDHAQIKGSLVMCCGFESNGGVIAWNTSINGDVDCAAGRFINPDNYALNLDECVIGGDLNFGTSFLLGVQPTDIFEANGVVEVGGTQIAGSTVVNGARFLGAHRERHGLIVAVTAVKGGLYLRNMLLQNDAYLNLAGSQIYFLVDEVKSWPMPGKLNIDGFKYEGFGNLSPGSASANTESPSDVVSRLHWIRLSAGGFNPQPYSQLAKVYRSAGNDVDANRVLIAREDARYASRGVLGAIVGGFLKFTIGYGHKPLLALAWSLLVVLAGWSVVSIGARAGVMCRTWPENRPEAEGERYEELHPLLYSLDVFLPFVNLHQEHYWWPDAQISGTCFTFGRAITIRGNYLRCYLWLQIIAGWLLSAIFIAGVTGLIRND